VIVTAPTQTVPLSLHDALPIYRFSIAAAKPLRPAIGQSGRTPGLFQCPSLSAVMPALVAGIHVFLSLIAANKTWMAGTSPAMTRSEEHTSELQSPDQLLCRLPL